MQRPSPFALASRHVSFPTSNPYFLNSSLTHNSPPTHKPVVMSEAILRLYRKIDSGLKKFYPPERHGKLDSKVDPLWRISVIMTLTEPMQPCDDRLVSILESATQSGCIIHLSDYVWKLANITFDDLDQIIACHCVDKLELVTD